VEKVVKAVMRKWGVRLKFAVLFVTVVALLGMVGTVAAANETDSTNINWTEIGNLISGVTEIFGPIGSLVVAVVPLIILFIIVGFITGLFDGIISGITGALRRI